MKVSFNKGFFFLSIKTKTLSSNLNAFLNSCLQYKHKDKKIFGDWNILRTLCNCTLASELRISAFITHVLIHSDLNVMAWHTIHLNSRIMQNLVPNWLLAHLII